MTGNWSIGGEDRYYEPPEQIDVDDEHPEWDYFDWLAEQDAIAEDMRQYKAEQEDWL